jgi:DNA-binding transcriptional regulator YhcF (GntR family)
MIDGLENLTKKNQKIFIYDSKMKATLITKKEYEVLIISGNNDRFRYVSKRKEEKKTKKKKMKKKLLESCIFRGKCFEINNKSIKTILIK